MSQLPYTVVLPLSDRTHLKQVGMIISDIDCFKPNNDDPNKSILFMKNKSFHFVHLSVDAISEKINQLLDGLDEPL
jgi:hypothetical protein